MPGPNPFPCGKPGQPACPPVPASGVSAQRTGEEPVVYTDTEMRAYGQTCYEQGRAYEVGKKLSFEK